MGKVFDKKNESGIPAGAKDIVSVSAGDGMCKFH